MTPTCLGRCDPTPIADCFATTKVQHRFVRAEGQRELADGARSLEVLVSSTVEEFLVLELGRAFFAGLLVLLAVDLLAVHAAVLDEAAGRAVLQLDGPAPVLAAVGTDITSAGRAADAKHVFFRGGHANWAEVLGALRAGECCIVASRRQPGGGAGGGGSLKFLLGLLLDVGKLLSTGGARSAVP